LQYNIYSLDALIVSPNHPFFLSGCYSIVTCLIVGNKININLMEIDQVIVANCTYKCNAPYNSVAMDKTQGMNSGHETTKLKFSVPTKLQ
jgi:hypothetical protein